MIEVTLIYPAYNEAKRIGDTIAKSVEYFEQEKISYEIIVSADGEDGTREIVHELGRENPKLIAIGNLDRRGKGYGLRQAVAIAQGAIIGFADADYKTPITEFGNFRPFLKDGWDMVIGSRALDRSKIERKQPWYRQLGSMGFSVFMHTIIGLRDIPDTQCGFKFFKSEVAKNLFSLQKIDGYMFDVEILYLAQLLGYCIKQVPVRWMDDGDTRLNLFSGNVRNFLDVLRIRSLHASVISIRN
jgi:dolichyl-phosphate beta-glucosyltransferase